jgi:hypothetical protein
MTQPSPDTLERETDKLFVTDIISRDEERPLEIVDGRVYRRLAAATARGTLAS